MLAWIRLNLGKGVWHTVQFVITALVLSQEMQDVVLWKQPRHYADAGNNQSLEAACPSAQQCNYRSTVGLP